MQVDRNHNQADLSLRALDSGSKISSATAATAPEGTLLLGQVVTASAGLVRVHIGRRTYGKVAVTDIHDAWVDNPTKGIAEGMYVKCCVVKASGPQEDALHLSLQASKGASWPGQGSAEQSPEEAAVEAVASVDQLKEGQQVCQFPSLSPGCLPSPPFGPLTPALLCVPCCVIALELLSVWMSKSASAWKHMRGSGH